MTDHYDDLADRTEPCPQTRCVFCEGLYDKPESDATDFDKFCSAFCETADANDQYPKGIV